MSFREQLNRLRPNVPPASAPTAGDPREPLMRAVALAVETQRDFLRCESMWLTRLRDATGDRFIARFVAAGERDEAVVVGAALAKEQTAAARAQQYSVWAKAAWLDAELRAATACGVAHDDRQVHYANDQERRRVLTFIQKCEKLIR